VSPHAMFLFGHVRAIPRLPASQRCPCLLPRPAKIPPGGRCFCLRTIAVVDSRLAQTSLKTRRTNRARSWCAVPPCFKGYWKQRDRYQPSPFRNGLATTPADMGYFDCRRLSPLVMPAAHPKKGIDQEPAGENVYFLSRSEVEECDFAS